VVDARRCAEVAVGFRRYQEQTASGGVDYEVLATFASDFESHEQFWSVGDEQECAAQADLLREVFGNPFRPAVLDPRWLAWGGGTVAALATAAYAENAFERLPVLADALEEAGCADETILAHLRAPGPHVRGCWALDLVRPHKGRSAARAARTARRRRA
jgi:hypothetical protein